MSVPIYVATGTLTNPLGKPHKPRFLLTTVASQTFIGGSPRPVRIDFYSPDLNCYEIAIPGGNKPIISE